MTEVVPNRAGVMAFVGQLEAAGVTQHVGVHWETQLRRLTGACHDLPHGTIGERTLALSGEHIG
jgi:hypothetical protein